LVSPAIIYPPVADDGRFHGGFILKIKAMSRQRPE
jgi:hypothetical protein